MAPEFAPFEVIALAGLVKKTGAFLAQNDLQQSIEPDQDEGFPQGMDFSPKTHRGGIAEFEDVGGDRLIILDDVDHILGRRFGIIDQLKGPLDHCRKGRQLGDRFENGVRLDS